MKLLMLFLLLTSFAFQSLANVCDPDEIFKLLIETGHVNIKDESFCVGLEEFPNVRIKMKEGKHDLGKPRELTDKMATQDANIKKLVGLLNSTSGEVSGQKFQINTRGFADGTFNELKEFDEKILNSICDISEDPIKKTKSYKISPKKVQSFISAMDPGGAEAIIAEIATINKSTKNAVDNAIPWDSIKDDSRLKSMIRNSFLAKSRGDKLCSDIFADNKSCQSTGEISPMLDTGEHCFAGCCDERRGNIIDIIAPQQSVISKGGNGTFKPPYKSPSRNLQGKLQMAAALSVFDLKLSADPVLEKDILEGKKFKENLQKDRERFQKALEGTGCEKNEFAVDSVRRMYWSVKAMKELVSPELYQAVMQGDFAKVYQIYQTPSTNPAFDVPNKNLLSTLFSGGNNKVAKIQNKENCPRIRAEDADWAADDSYSSCKIASTSSPEIFNLLKKQGKGGKVTANDNLFELSKLTKVNNSEEQDFYVVQDMVTKNNYYLYDRKSNKSHYFSFDHTSDECSLLGPGYNYKAKTPKRIDSELTLSCLQLATNSNVKIPESFAPQAPSVNSVVPSDPLNCLNPSKGLDHELRNLNPDGEPAVSMEAGNYQKPLCKLQSGGSLNVVLDPKDLTVISGAAAGKQGFMCTGCASGIVYNPKTKKFEYNARQENKNIDDESGTQKAQAKRTWSEAKGPGLTMAGLKHLKTYVIPNCGPSCENACECLRDGNINSTLLNPNVVALDFTDLSNGNSKAVISSDPKESKDVTPGIRQFSCVFTPPVPHTCSFNPLGDTPTELKSDEHFSERCPITEALKKLPKVTSEPITEDTIKEYRARCKKDNFPSTEASCQAVRGGPMCAKKRIANQCQEPKYKAPSNTPSKGKQQ